MQNGPHETELLESQRDPAARCDLDDLVPPSRRCDWINWSIGFVEVSGLVIFFSVFIFLLVKYFAGIDR